MTIRRLILVRHGETVGESSVRYYGSTDLPLSATGYAQMRRMASELRYEPADLILASTLCRSWKSASLLSNGGPVRLLAGLREVHFGHWEGLSKAEIQARDPVLFEDWQNAAEGFEYPSGELRADFRARVAAAIDVAVAAPGHTAIGVLHKGVIREIIRHLSGASVGTDQPALAGRLVLIRRADGWRLGQQSTDPADENAEA